MRYVFPETHLERPTEVRWACKGVRCNNEPALPYMTSYTWNVAIETAKVKHTWVPSNHERNVFVLYMTSTVPHGDKLVRGILKHTCHQHLQMQRLGTEEVPKGFDKALQCDFKWQHHHALFKLYARYCLEAGGDTAGRKSITDDYASGCIPVFIGDSMAVPYPEFWR
eukprot:4755122-Amphidinium_carterae.1